MTSAPDYVGPVTAWRLWRVDTAGVLRSPQQMTPWPTGWLDATCAIAGSIVARAVVKETSRPSSAYICTSIETVPEHDAPDADCHCGLYAVDTPLDAVERGWSSLRYPAWMAGVGIAPDRGMDLVLGTVELNGDYVRHEWGWRHAQARVTGLAGVDQRVTRACARYEVAPLDWTYETTVADQTLHAYMALAADAAEQGRVWT